MVALRQGGGPYGGRDALNFTWRGPQVQAQINSALETAFHITERAAVAKARSLARVDTGAMQRGLGAEVTLRGLARRLTLVLYGEEDHTIFNEIGTANMSAQPMIRPAMDEEAPRLTERVRAAMRSMR